MIAATRIRRRADGSFARDSVRLIVLSAAAFDSAPEGAAPREQGGGLTVRTAAGILARGDYVRTPDGLAYSVRTTRGLSPFYHLAEIELEETRLPAGAAA